MQCDGNVKESSLIDIHVHAPPFEAIDLRGGEKFRLKETLALKYFKYRLGIESNDSNPSKTYLDKLAKEIIGSKRVEKAVLLPLDGVYGESGRIDAQRTRFMVSNDLILQWAGEYEVFIPACSINPFRRDAIEELERCASMGAALNKVLPNTQGFDPLDKRLKPFWRMMSELKMPLLTHAGFEFALKTINNAYGNPARFLPALEEGVSVILAHGGSAGVFFPELYFDKVRSMLKAYPNLYIDTSAVTLPTRMGIVKKLLKIEGIDKRLVFGTDYPVPAFALPLLTHLKMKDYLEARRNSNYFDFSCEVLERLGLKFDRKVAASLLRAG